MMSSDDWGIRNEIRRVFEVVSKLRNSFWWKNVNFGENWIFSQNPSFLRFFSWKATYLKGCLRGTYSKTRENFLELSRMTPGEEKQAYDIDMPHPEPRN